MRLRARSDWRELQSDRKPLLPSWLPFACHHCSENYTGYATKIWRNFTPLRATRTRNNSVNRRFVRARNLEKWTKLKISRNRSENGDDRFSGFGLANPTSEIQDGGFDTGHSDPKRKILAIFFCIVSFRRGTNFCDRFGSSMFAVTFWK